LVAALVCMLLSLYGHLSAGGDLPNGGLLCLLGLLLAGFLIALADRRRGPLAVLAMVGGAQLALHVLLQLLGGAQQAHSCMHAMPSTGPNPLLMTAGHALATVVTAAVLAGAESAVFTVAAVLARALPRPLAALPAPAAPARLVAVATPPGVRASGVTVARLYQRRGPPGER
jgi:hypothetical protein